MSQSAFIVRRSRMESTLEKCSRSRQGGGEVPEDLQRTGWLARRHCGCQPGSGPCRCQPNATNKPVAFAARASNFPRLLPTGWRSSVDKLFVCCGCLEEKEIRNRACQATCGGKRHNHFEWRIFIIYYQLSALIESRVLNFSQANSINFRKQQQQL